MKYILTENKIKDMIKSNFGLDLTGKIDKVTDKWDLPFEFDKFFSERLFNHHISKFGPMYAFDTPKGKFLAQYRGEKMDGWAIADTSDFGLSELDFMKILGIEYLGMSLNDLINLYLTNNSKN